MACRVVDEIHTPRVHCPTCMRDYFIVKRVHRCEGLFKCDSRALSANDDVMEKYHTDVVASAVSAECEQCKDAAISKVIVGVCPQCDYNGRFAPSADGRCPACVAAPAPKERKQKTDVEAVPAREAGRQTLYVFIEKDLSVRACTQADIIAGRFDAMKPDCDPDTKTAALLLSNWLKSAASSYDIRWMYPHDETVCDFLRKYYANAPDGHFVIPFP